MLNFSNFKVVETSNTKAAGFGGRAALAYNFRYSRYLSKKADDKGEKSTHEEFFFEVSQSKFDELNLKDYGMVQVVSPDGISYLAVVDNDNAVILKTTGKNKEGEKGRKFKSTIIESALAAQGLIDTKIVGEPQYLDLKLVEGSEGAMLGEGTGAIKAYGVYEVVKGEKPVEATKTEAEATPKTSEVAETASTDEASAPPVGETAAPTAEAPATPPASDDDF